jgi:predicted nucleotidyltransferase
MVRQLRARGYETIVCAMSGPFVQRAEPAFLPTHVRAAAALAGGADLVLRLPVPYAVASAEAFAAGGAGLLSALGCADVLAFGSEVEETELLCGIADMLYGKEFKEALQAQLAQGVSFAAARAAAAEQVMSGASRVLRTPNNILGVEYCKALRHTLPKTLGKLAEAKEAKPNERKGDAALPRPLALRRMGANHDGEPRGGVASAHWLRGQAAADRVAAWQSWVPQECMPIYKKAESAGVCINKARYEVAMLSRLRAAQPEAFAKQGATEGLDVRLAAAAHKALALEELYMLAKSKRFAHSRVRRLALATALELPAGLPAVPPFAHVLAANKKGFALLRTAKQTALIPISASLAKLSKTGITAAAVARAEAAAEDLFALCQQVPRSGGTAYTTPAVFEAE